MSVSRKSFYLDTLAVLPAHRGRGIAPELFKAMIERAQSEWKTPKPGSLVDMDTIPEHADSMSVGVCAGG